MDQVQNDTINYLIDNLDTLNVNDTIAMDGDWIIQADNPGLPYIPNTVFLMSSNPDMLMSCVCQLFLDINLFYQRDYKQTTNEYKLIMNDSYKTVIYISQRDEVFEQSASTRQVTPYKGYIYSYEDALRYNIQKCLHEVTYERTLNIFFYLSSNNLLVSPNNYIQFSLQGISWGFLNSDEFSYYCVSKGINSEAIAQTIRFFMEGYEGNNLSQQDHLWHGDSKCWTIGVSNYYLVCHSPNEILIPWLC